MSTLVVFPLVIRVLKRMMSSDSLSDPPDATPGGGASEGVWVVLAYQERDDEHIL